ncbi:GNAT family N-acetyltransferase [Gordonia phthalatica]|uniref:GNAT family N-acetyltransferase n=1 Tax=Gordonia phthalatica TaxID=1136941 RepID=UPI0007862B64|nr:GNAT family protein [Gordonia phthalatica]
MAAPMPETITTARLVLSRPSAADLPRITECCREAQVQEWTTVPSPYTAESAAYFLGEVIDPGWAGGSAYTWAVRLADRLIGMVGVDVEEAGGAEVGFWLAPEARGRGLMTEATTAAVHAAFESLDLQRISWSAFAGNVGSARVAQACGFRFEGVRALGAVQRGVRRDEWLGGLTVGDSGVGDSGAASSWPAHVVGAAEA